MIAFISAGSIQLLVGPASASSTRADEGAVLDPGDVASGRSARQNEFGFFAGSSRTRVPASTSSSVSRVHSSSEPSHQHDPVGLGQLGDLGHPREQPAWRGGGCRACRLSRHRRGIPFHVADQYPWRVGVTVARREPTPAGGW